MQFEDLSLWRVITGVDFGQECYLDRRRSEAFHESMNEIFPNFFTRYNYQQIPNLLSFEHPSKRQFTATLNRLNYIAYEDIDSESFLNQFRAIFDCFKNLFALDDIRRVGKIFDFKLPHESPDSFLQKLVVIKDEVLVSDVRLLFHHEGKNINVLFKAISSEIRFETGDKAIMDPGIVIRCDINNIDIDSPLDMSTIFEDIFTFADDYVKTGFIDLIKEYLGD